jgi:hypothetical protein
MTLQAACKLGMGSGRPLGFHTQSVASQTLGIFGKAAVNFGKSFDGRAMHTKVIPISTTGYKKDNDASQEQ